MRSSFWRQRQSRQLQKLTVISILKDFRLLQIERFLFHVVPTYTCGTIVPLQVCEYHRMCNYKYQAYYTLILRSYII